jgi:hypothetical protein
MHHAGLKFRGMISLLLKKHKANPGSASEYVRSITEETEIQFDEIIHLVKDAQVKQFSQI